MAKTELYNQLVESSFDFASSMPSGHVDLALQVHSSADISFRHVTPDAMRFIREDIPRFAAGEITEDELTVALRDLLVLTVKPFIDDARSFGRTTVSAMAHMLRGSMGERQTELLLSVMRLSIVEGKDPN